jgi:hypothetical protein
MTRIAVLVVALVFLLGFAFLTIDELSRRGLTVAGALSLAILAVMTVGIVGALRNPPHP